MKQWLLGKIYNFSNFGIVKTFQAEEKTKTTIDNSNINEVTYHLNPEKKVEPKPIPKPIKRVSSEQIFQNFLTNSKTIERKKEIEKEEAEQKKQKDEYLGTYNYSSPNPFEFSDELLEYDSNYSRLNRRLHLTNIYKLMNAMAKCSKFPKDLNSQHPFIKDMETFENLQYSCFISGMIDEDTSFDLTHRCLPSPDTILYIVNDTLNNHLHNQQQQFNKEDNLRLSKLEIEDIIKQCNTCLNGSDQHTSLIKKMYLETKDLIFENQSLRGFLPKVSDILNHINVTDGLKDEFTKKSRELYSVNQYNDNKKKIIDKVNWSRVRLLRREFNDMRDCLHKNENNHDQCRFQVTDYTVQSRAIACSKEIAYCLKNYNEIVKKLQEHQEKRNVTQNLAFGGNEENAIDDETEKLFGNDNDWGDYEDEEGRKKKTVNKKDDDEDFNKSITSQSSTNWMLNNSKSKLEKEKEELRKLEEEQERLRNAAIMKQNNTEENKEIEEEKTFLDEDIILEDETITGASMERFIRCMTIYNPTVTCIRKVEKILGDQYKRTKKKNDRKKRKKEREKTYQEKMYDFTTNFNEKK
ncbi:hypothetical protein ABK040_005352 [Willaertia magna]